MAGERLGSAVAVRSTAPRFSGAPSSGSIEARFGPVLTPFNRGPNPNAFKIRSFGPVTNIVPESGKDSGPKPKVVFLGLIRNIISEIGRDSSQPNVVTKTLKFAQSQPAVEFPETGVGPKTIDQSKGRIVFQEPSRVKSALTPEINQPIQTRPGVEIKTPPKTAEAKIQVLLEQQLRVSRGLALVRAVRTAQRVAVNPEIQPVAKTQTGTATETATQTSVGIAVKTKVETSKGSGARTGKKEATILKRNPKVFLRLPKLVIDEEINKARVEALIAEKNRQQVNNPGIAPSFESTVARSGVTYFRQFRAGLSEQLGLEQDGSQGWMHKDAAVDKSEATEEKIRDFVDKHAAVKEGEGPRVAKREEIDKVIRPPEELAPIADPEKALAKTSIEINDEPNQGLSKGNLPAEQLSNNVQTDSSTVEGEGELGLQQEIFGIHPDIAKPILDIGEYINNLASIRRELVLAA